MSALGDVGWGLAPGSSVTSAWHTGDTTTDTISGTSSTSPPPPSPPTAEVDALLNAGSGSGSLPWTQSSTGGYTLVEPSRPWTGSSSAWRGGHNSGTDSATLRTFSGVSGAGVWRQDATDLSSCGGRAVRVAFVVQTDSSLTTSFSIDDTALTRS